MSMTSRAARRRILLIWVTVFILCALLLGFASVRRYRLAAVLTLHIDELEHRLGRIATDNTHQPDQSSKPQVESLAERSREQYASSLGLVNSSGPRIMLESEKWKPMILRECTEDMPPYYAPCLAKVKPNLEYGEEIVYPDFEAAMPGFFNADDAQQWLDTNYGPGSQGQTGANKRVIVDRRQGRLVFSGLRGQNLVFKDVAYTDGGLPTTWLSDSSHCLGHMSTTETFEQVVRPPLQSPPQQEEGHQRGRGRGRRQQRGRQGSAAGMGVRGLADAGLQVVEEAAVYVTPDSERYQHWLDHTTKPLMQSAHLISGSTRIILGSSLESKQDIVQIMWSWLPHIKRKQFMTPTYELMHVRRLLVSCRVPYVHPYLFFRLQEMVMGPDAPRVPLSERKVVVWYSRSSNDLSRQNSGREIVNEKEVMDAIEELLKSRGRGERLEVHPPVASSMDPLDYILYLNRNAAAFLGPHGGGLCNFKWLATNTLVLELMPRDWINTPLYEEAIGHGLNYWVDLLEPRGHNHNMAANVSNIISLLSEELGKEPVRGPIIRYRYDWPAVLDDTVGRDANLSNYFTSLKGKCCNAGPGGPGAEGPYVLPRRAPTQ